jgi:glutamate-ammonia-ligase adenylyltransferase
MMNLNAQSIPLPEDLPTDLKDLALKFLERLNEQLTQSPAAFINDAKVIEALPRVFICSEFVREALSKTPALLDDLVQSGDLYRSERRIHYAESLNRSSIENDADLMKVLRLFRRREMIRIAWRDLAGWAELDETLRDLTALAEVCIQKTLDFHYQAACLRRGTPLFADGRPMNIVVLGMGKLGGYELNYSSDIDLIFAFPEDGTLNDRRETSYSEFFTRMCQAIVKTLDDITMDGFVFRTDVRLRPFGNSGPIVMNFDGMEHYYLTQAREWERYAMIKARPVAGDLESGESLMAMIRRFVYRRYLDYGAFAELRSLKLQIIQELQRKDRQDNIKLGRGGIREIEFIGQAFQLIRGGQEKQLQERSILKVLNILESLELMTTEDVRQLHQGYVFLRRVENHIQEYQDKQCHDLPTKPDYQAILAYSLGYPDWKSLLDILNPVRDAVHSIFQGVFSMSDQEESVKNSNRIWMDHMEDETVLDWLNNYGFQDPPAVLNALRYFKQSHAMRKLTAKGREVMNRLLPMTIEGVAERANPDATLQRLLVLFESVAGRNVYLALLSENPEALAQLIQLASASLWICEYLAQYPILFDELLDPRTLYAPLQKQPLWQELGRELKQKETSDLETFMIVLRQFKHANILRVAAADIMRYIPLMVVSDYLTYIAEVVLDYVLAEAWALTVEKHGYPPNVSDEHQGFAILGLGKLGGLELGYGSDLDMVFLYDAENGQAMTDGAKSIDTTQFYIRLGQKIRHILDTKMLSGVLYEVDLRLRPSGDSGLLVTHIGAYETYMHKEAWTWEHQALVRGRFITGDLTLKQHYERIRHDVLALERNIPALQTEVREMREKMRDNLAPKESDVFDLKQSKGGIADIEFIVQFKILAHSAACPELTTFTDNVRLLEGLAEQGFITTEQAHALKHAYCTYRDFGHRQVLQGHKARVTGDEFQSLRVQVEQLWHEYME